MPDPQGLLSRILTLAQERFAAGKYTEAEAFLQVVPQPGTEPGATWRQLAQLHFALAEYEAAGQAFGYAAAYAPREADLQVQLAHTCLQLEDLPAFEGYLRRAFALEPENAAALQLLGDLHRDTGQYEEAVGCYERLLAVKADHHESLLSLALCHSFLGDSESAKECLHRAGFARRRPLTASEE